ncbi:MAG: hypothetical protein U1F16_09620 [Turneriella sp.]
MKPRNLIIALIAALAVFYFLTREGEKPASQTQKRSDEVQVIASRENSADYQPDLESYRLERESVLLSNNIAGPRLKPEFAGMPAYRQSNLRLKVPAGPIDDYGAPLFVPSETAMTDPKIFEQELAKHKERSESYTAARMDELKMNTGVEREQMRATIDQAKASGSKPPEEIKRAEAAYDRMAILEKVLKGEKVDKILD